jgi:hypothetical protein
MVVCDVLSMWSVVALVVLVSFTVIIICGFEARSERNFDFEERLVGHRSLLASARMQAERNL